MDAYIYQASLVCDCCGRDIISRLNDTTEDNGDSDTFPQGPYEMGGGESDTPQHCDRCGDFLQNPLTMDGEAYVRENYENKTWRLFYSYLFQEL